MECILNKIIASQTRICKEIVLYDWFSIWIGKEFIHSKTPNDQKKFLKRFFHKSNPKELLWNAILDTQASAIDTQCGALFVLSADTLECWEYISRVIQGLPCLVSFLH